MSIHPTAIIEDDVQMGNGCVIHAGAMIRRYSILGDGVVVHPYAIVGGEPQYLKYDPSTVSYARIGEHTIIREHVTINRSIYNGQATVVGAHCLIMANVHLGHDAIVSDRVVLANNVLLAGHVEIGPHAVLGGGAAVHQYCRVGEGVMVSGLSRVSKDVAPFLMVAERDEMPGFNFLGMKRRGLPREAIAEIKKCYAQVFVGGDPRPIAADLLSAGVQSREARCFLEFFAGGKRGFVRPNNRRTSREEDEPEDKSDS